MVEYNGVAITDEIVLQLAIVLKLQIKKLNNSVLDDGFIADCGGGGDVYYQLCNLVEAPIPVIKLGDEWHELVYNNYVFNDVNFK